MRHAVCTGIRQIRADRRSLKECVVLLRNKRQPAHLAQASAILIKARISHQPNTASIRRIADGA
jgi:hypothetical protein